MIMKTLFVIYLAGGCFWGVEHFIQFLPGVVDTEVGYANSIVPSPSYQDVCTGKTQAVETVKVTYDPEQMPLSFLLDQFFLIIDPTSLNKQGNDRGTQYRTGIYYTEPSDKPIIEQALQRLQSKYRRQVVVEAMPLKNYFSAETMHQDYLANTPGGYCHVPIEMFRVAKEAKVPAGAVEADRKLRASVK